MAYRTKFEGIDVEVDDELWEDLEVKINDGRHGIWVTRKMCFETFLQESSTYKHAKENFSSIKFKYVPDLKGDHGQTVYEVTRKIKTKDNAGNVVEQPIHLLVKATVTSNKSSGLFGRIVGKNKSDLLFECNTLPFMDNPVDHFNWYKQNMKKYT